jgi:hypothetical protein
VSRSLAHAVTDFGLCGAGGALLLLASYMLGRLRADARRPRWDEGS